MQIAKDLLPHYSSIIAIVLVILPTLFALLSRYCLDRYLKVLIKRISRLLLDIDTDKRPHIIDRIEQKLRLKNNYQHINSGVLIYNAYNQETIGRFCLRIRCEQLDNFCQIIPNLLLACGLLGTFLGIIVNLNQLAHVLDKIDLNDLNKLISELNKIFQSIGLSFIISIVAVACSFLLTVFNSIWNTNLTKAELFNCLEDYIYNCYLPNSQVVKSNEETIEKLTESLENFLNKYVDIIEQTLEKAVEKIEKNSIVVNRTAMAIEKNQVSEQISSAANNFTIAQDKFSISSSQLQHSTQTLASILYSLQQTTKQLAEIREEIKVYLQSKQK